MAKLPVSGLWQAAKLREKLTIIIGLAYIISPLDIIPEVILGPLGLLDDGGALLAVILTLTTVMNRYKRNGGTVIEGEEVQK